MALLIFLALFFHAGGGGLITLQVPRKGPGIYLRSLMPVANFSVGYSKRVTMLRDFL